MSDTDNTIFWEKVEQIEGLSLKIGLNHVSGQKENYEKSLKLIMKEIEKNDKTLIDLLESGDLQNLSIIVHGMKGTLAFIGATDISAMAGGLEKAANLKNKDYCTINLPLFVEEIKKLKSNLDAAFELKPVIQDSGERPPELSLILQNLAAAIDETDFMAINEGVEKLDTLKVGGVLYEEIEKIKDAVLVMEYETALEVIKNIS
ncbi:MAG: Hpt domain-containing protein [Treponema sp.]|jgi:HPt (histidine-containing phosphotransfer) domain-containing protein|nr:Hpt domain-containing protein [Treponema sp.]